MEKSELIDLIKGPAVEVMNEKKVLASILIAESIRLLFSDDMITCYSDLVAGNNPIAVEADKKYSGETIYNEKKKVVYRTYGSLEEGIANYVTLNSEKFDVIKEIYDYETALSKLSAKFYDIADLKKYIESYRLYDIDSKQLKKMYSGNKTVVETVPENKTTLFLKDMAGIHDGVGLNKTKAQVVREEKKAMEEKVKNERIKTPLTAGTPVTLHRTNLYKSIEAGTPMRAISGTYYLMDGICKYERYAIVMKKEYTRKPQFVLGYVDASDINVG